MLACSVDRTVEETYLHTYERQIDNGTVTLALHHDEFVLQPDQHTEHVGIEHTSVRLDVESIHR